MASPQNIQKNFHRMIINNLKAILSERGMKSKDLASHLGVLATQVSQWANGRPCSEANARRIADFIGVRVEDLSAPRSQDPAVAKWLASGNQLHTSRELQLEREKLELKERIMGLEREVEQGAIRARRETWDQVRHFLTAIAGALDPISQDEIPAVEVRLYNETGRYEAAEMASELLRQIRLLRAAGDSCAPPSKLGAKAMTAPSASDTHKADGTAISGQEQSQRQSGGGFQEQRQRQSR